MRVIIAGWPRSGKTTLAAEMARASDLRLRHTDDTMATLDWSAGSAAVAFWFDEPGPWIVEGVSAVRALRKWREAHPGEPPPCDKFIYLSEAVVAMTAKQIAMGKGVDTVLAGIAEWIDPVRSK